MWPFKPKIEDLEDELAEIDAKLKFIADMCQKGIGTYGDIARAEDLIGRRAALQSKLDRMKGAAK